MSAVLVRIDGLRLGGPNAKRGTTRGAAMATNDMVCADCGTPVSGDTARQAIKADRLPHCRRCAHSPWSSGELETLRAYYKSPDGSVRLAQLAKKLGRSKPNICRKARELGLTNRHRRYEIQLKLPIRSLSPEEQSRRISESLKQRIRVQGHPRGMAGRRHTPEVCAKISTLSRIMWADPASKLNSESYKQHQSDAMSARQANDPRMRHGYSRGKMGRRGDLDDVYFRSSWEANYARYLKFMQARGEVASWGYETRTFWFEAIKRGTRSYLPDFEVTFMDGRHEWHEVKGWMDDKSKTKLARMAIYYPDEVVRIIGEGWFKQARKGGLAAVIPHWESNGRGLRGC